MQLRKLALALVALLPFVSPVKAQDALVVATCGTLPLAYTAGSTRLPTVDVNGKLCLSGGGGGSGTVTSVSVTTANGVSGTVATATTTPAITLTLGAITPSTVTIGAGSAITSSGAGGALGTNAFTSTAYLPLTGGTLTGNLSIVPSSANTEPLTITMGTMTATTKGINVTAVWNNSGIAGTLIFGNVTTDTSSNAAALLMDLQVGSTSKFKVDKTGAATLVTSLAIGGATIGSNALAVAGTVNLTGNVTIGTNTSNSHTFNGTVNFDGNFAVFDSAAVASMGNATKFGFSSGGSATSAPDTVLSRFGVGTLGLSDSTTITEWQQYATTDSTTSPTNYARAFSRFANNGAAADTWAIGAEKGGTGTSPSKWSLSLAGTRLLDIAVTTANVFTVSSTGGLTLTSTTDASASSGSGALQVPGGGSVAKRFWLPAITASAGLQTAVLCQSSGGEVIADSVACLASSARFKEGFIAISDQSALRTVLAMPISSWRYRREPDSVFPDSYYRERIGFIAEDLAAIDPRLAAFGTDGQVRSDDYNAVVTLQAGAIRALKAEIDELKRRVQ